MSEAKRIHVYEAVNGMRIVSYVLEDTTTSVLLDNPFVFRVSQNPQNPAQPVFNFTPMTMFSKSQQVRVQKHNVIFDYEPEGQIVSTYKAMLEQDRANRSGILQPKKKQIVMP